MLSSRSIQMTRNAHGGNNSDTFPLLVVIGWPPHPRPDTVLMKQSKRKNAVTAFSPLSSDNSAPPKR